MIRAENGATRVRPFEALNCADLGDVGPGGLHLTVGGGMRLYWDQDFVIRADAGLSSEQKYYGLKVRNIF